MRHLRLLPMAVVLPSAVLAAVGAGALVAALGSGGGGDRAPRPGPSSPGSCVARVARATSSASIAAARHAGATARAQESATRSAAGTGPDGRPRRATATITVPVSVTERASVTVREDVTQTAAFQQKQIVIQDEGSQLVAALIGQTDHEGSRILDCCAAPGGKTLAMADRNPSASITALELHPHRARLMRKLLEGNPSMHIDTVIGDARTKCCHAPMVETSLPNGRTPRQRSVDGQTD